MFDPKRAADYWAAVGAATGFRDDACAFLDGIAAFLTRAEGSMDWTKSVFESETWQFGEFAAASCALADVSFVPFHTRLLRLWDLDHEVNQGATIKRIVRRHGLRSEVEELLFVRCVEEPGQGYFLELEDAADLLESKYGDLSQAPLLRKIASAIYTKNHAYRRTEWEKYLSKKYARPRKITDRGYFGASKTSKLHDAAVRIVADLDAAAGPTPWYDVDYTDIGPDGHLFPS